MAGQQITDSNITSISDTKNYSLPRNSSEGNPRLREGYSSLVSIAKLGLPMA